MATEDWAVLGGGVLGMSVALELAQRGRRVTLIEAAAEPGGLVSPWSIGNTSWDRFYHVIASSDQRLLALLRQLGLEQELVWAQTRTLFFDGRGMHPLNNVFDYLRLPGLGLLDKLRLGLNIIYGASLRDPQRLEDRSAEQWLSRISGRNAYQRLWQPLLRAKLGSNEPRASAALVATIMRRFYGAREGRTKVERYGYVHGGYRRVIDAFTRKLVEAGVDIQCDARVEQLSPHPDGGLEVRYGDSVRRFDKTVATFAAPILARLCGALSPALAQRLTAIHYQGVVCVSLLLRRGLGDAYLTYITDQSLPFTTVIEMSSLVDRDELQGHHLVYLPKYVPSDDPILEREDQQIIDEFMAGLRRMYPDLRQADIVTARVARTPYVAPVMTLNYSDLVPPVRTGIPGLYLVSSAQLVEASSSVEATLGLVERGLPQLLDEPAGRAG